jgi:hypothetical protein
MLILKVVRDCTEIVQNPPNLGAATWGTVLAGGAGPKRQKRQQRCWRQDVKAITPNRDSNSDSVFCPEKMDKILRGREIFGAESVAAAQMGYELREDRRYGALKTA